MYQKSCTYLDIAMYLVSSLFDKIVVSERARSARSFTDYEINEPFANAERERANRKNMNMMEETIRSIQHYLYCPHRWGSLKLDKAWAENFFRDKAIVCMTVCTRPESSLYN